VAAGVIAAGLTATIATAGDDRGATRALMDRIYASMEVLLPLSADPERLADPAKQPLVRDALARLAANADTLAAHAGTRDAEAVYLGRAIAHDAREAARFHAEGRMDGAAFYLQQTTANCVACHSRLPHPGDASISAGFVRDATLAGLPPLARARLLVATRRFTEALAAYETAFADPKLHPIDMGAAWVDYLVVSLRGLGDFARPIPVLERLAARPDAWANLREDAHTWAAALPSLAPTARMADLAKARTLVEQAKKRTRFPDDQRALVAYVAASGILHRHLAAAPARSATLGDTYYLLGACELHIHGDYWTSQADFFLESAIRAAPHTAVAREAYALLEQATLFAHTGSSGEHVPADVRRRLAELRDLASAR
jgi:hypothetical protein